MNSLHWFQGAGTDEQVLTEILASRTPAEIRNIKQAYQEGNLYLWGGDFIKFQRACSVEYNVLF